MASNRRSDLVQNLALLLVSSVISGGVGWAVWQWWSARSSEQVLVIDNSREVDEILEERAVEVDRELDPEEGPVPLPRLRREPLDEETALRFFPAIRGRGHVYDRYSYFRPTGNRRFRIDWPEHPEGGWEMHLNSQGMRRYEDVREQAPDLRIAIAGDSHTAGKVPIEESFATLVERHLSSAHPSKSVESLNFGVGGAHVYYYLGLLERIEATLAPDVFVTVVYGGNDFAGSMALSWYFDRRRPEGTGMYPPKKLNPMVRANSKEFAQEFRQVAFFLDYPSEVQTAIDVAVGVSAETYRICESAGIQAVFVYLPPPSVQPRCFEDVNKPILELLDAPPSSILVSDRIADVWLSFLESKGMTSLDLRDRFRASEECLYWQTDHHLNTQGHRIVAEELTPILEDLVSF